MKLSFSFLLLALCSVFSSGLVNAQDFDSAIVRITPPGIHLGSSLSELRVNRPDAFEGPSASIPGSKSIQDLKPFPTYMENQGVGAPGHVSFWYLFSQNKVVGVLKTKSLIGVNPEAGSTEAQEWFRSLSESLGEARQETLMRKGASAFVPVRADVWSDSTSGRTVYFIATDKELTVAAVERSDFPLAQVFIPPNAERFPIEEPAKRTIHDIVRPSVAAVPVTSHTSEVQPQLKTQTRLEMESLPKEMQEAGRTSASVDKSTLNATLPSAEKRPPSILIAVGIAALLVGFGIVLYKRIYHR